MDNQQERLGDLSWVAGILEGEGSFVVNKHQLPHGRIDFYTKVILGNTDESMIRLVAEKLLRYGASGWVTTKYRKIPYRTCYYLIYNGLRRCHTVVDLVEPFVLTEYKRQALSIFRAYIEGRLQKEKGRFDAEDLARVNALRTLYGYAKTPIILRDLTPSPALSAGDDKVQP